MKNSEAAALANAAIERARMGAESQIPDWTSKAAGTCEYLLADRRGEFVTATWLRDQAILVNPELKVSEPRAWGAVIRRLRDDGWIERSGMFVPSPDPKAHNRPTAVWKVC